MHPTAPPLLAAAPTLTIEAVVATYSHYVATVGYRILGRHTDLEDLLQDVFLEVHRNLRTLRDPEALRAWLITITVRTARRMLRKRKLAEIFLPFDVLRSSDPVDVGASAEERHWYSRVYAVLDRQPANLRIAWVLREIEGEPLAKVAELCGCSLAAVKRRIAKVEDALGRELGHV